MPTRRTILTASSGAFAWLSASVMNVRRTAGQVRQKPKRLVLVHGRSQEGRDPKEIKAEWLNALQIGAGKLGREIPRNLDVALPYYGDTLDAFVEQLDAPLAEDIKARGNPNDSEFLEFQGRVADELRIKAQITDDQVNAEYASNTKPRGPLNWDWVQAILRALDKYGPGMSKKTVELFTRDVFLYITRPGIQSEVDKIVANALTLEPTVIVGHSLGSVVAYHLLRTDPRSLQVPLYVTVGSPLGIRAIREQLIPLRFPRPPLAAWYNAFDTRDTIALYPLNKDNFAVTPEVENYDGVKNQTDNRHGIAGYLNDPQIAGRILDALAA
jgi:hypothetical protein